LFKPEQCRGAYLSFEVKKHRLHGLPRRYAPRNDEVVAVIASLTRHCEPPVSGQIPHTDLEPDPVIASEARQSMRF
jgi:hypothetical protein